MECPTIVCEAGDVASQEVSPSADAWEWVAAFVLTIQRTAVLFQGSLFALDYHGSLSIGNLIFLGSYFGGSTCAIWDLGKAEEPC